MAPSRLQPLLAMAACAIVVLKGAVTIAQGAQGAAQHPTQAQDLVGIGFLFVFLGAMVAYRRSAFLLGVAIALAGAGFGLRYFHVMDAFDGTVASVRPTGMSAALDFDLFCIVAMVIGLRPMARWRQARPAATRQGFVAVQSPPSEDSSSLWAPRQVASAAGGWRTQADDRLGTLVGTVGAIALLVVIPLWTAHHIARQLAFQREGVTVQGTVLKTYSHAEISPRGRRIGTRYFLEYEYRPAGGKTQIARAEVSLLDSHVAGDRLPVRYLRRDPAISELWNRGPSLWTVASILASIACILILAGSLVYGFLRYVYPGWARQESRAIGEIAARGGLSASASGGASNFEDPRGG